MIPTLAEEKLGVTALIVPKEQKSHFKQLFRRGSDMKFKLEFLKRRHTEGSISVRPSPEEAEKWENSFNNLVASKYGLTLFKAFLQREFCEENLEFWLAVEDYRKCRPNKLTSKALKIYTDFIAPQAPKEVNLDAVTKNSLETDIAQPTLSTFDHAQKKIQGLLEADAYTRFLKSDLYLELVQPEKYGDVIEYLSNGTSRK